MMRVILMVRMMLYSGCVGSGILYPNPPGPGARDEDNAESNNFIRLRLSTGQASNYLWVKQHHV